MNNSDVQNGDCAIWDPDSSNNIQGHSSSAKILLIPLQVSLEHGPLQAAGQLGEMAIILNASAIKWDILESFS